jgi:hypothetical protein
MSRLRTDFYNDPPLEGDVAIADKDGLALDFVGIADSRPLVHFSGLATFLWHTGCGIPPWRAAFRR